jgi:5'-methylthioadenosine phosphorylase
MKINKFIKPEIAIIGGSGFEKFPELDKGRITTVKPYTKYGYPSDKIIISEYGNKTVAFLPRHGKNHSLPPHKIPYKANIAALKQLGINYIIGTCVAGSLKKKIKPGDFVIINQFINLTWGRDDYFDMNKKFTHLPLADPYCPNLRKLIYSCAKELGLSIHKKGVVVVIQGPRFSTIAESKWFIKEEWDLVNMTQYPECYFARELGMCYAAIASITDYDVGIQNNIQMGNGNYNKVLKIFNTNIQKMKKLILEILSKNFPKRNCDCQYNSLIPYYDKKR